MDLLHVTSFEDMPAGIQSLLEMNLRLFNEIADIKKVITPPGKPSFITRAEAAAVLNISKNTLDSYTRSGIVQGYRVGTRILFKEDEITARVTKIKSAVVQ